MDLTKVWVVWISILCAYVSVVPIYAQPMEGKMSIGFSFTLPDFGWLGDTTTARTKNTVIFRFMSGGNERCRQRFKVLTMPQENWVWYSVDIPQTTSDVTSVEVHIRGDDRLGIDYAKLVEYYGLDHGRTWNFGVESGGGYCVSKDDLDTFGTNECYHGLQFPWYDDARTVSAYNGTDDTLCGLGFKQLVGYDHPPPLAEPPSSSPSCMSGNTGLMKVEKVDCNLRNEKEVSMQDTNFTDLKVSDNIQGNDNMMQVSTCSREAIGEFGFGSPYGNCTNDGCTLNPSLRNEQEERIQVTKLSDLKLGDNIQGYDAMMQLSTCSIEAIGEFGFGPLYGNYTDGHYILNPSTGMIEEHGSLPSHVVTKENKYQILTDCPLGIDESDTKFTPIDSDFCGKHMTEMSWTDYVLLHKGILRIVRATGGFWFSISSYSDMEAVGKYAPLLCASMLKCMKDSKDCEHFEIDSITFIDNTLNEFSKTIAKDVFPEIGSHFKLGSAAATLTAGKSVVSKTIAEDMFLGFVPVSLSV